VYLFIFLASSVLAVVLRYWGQQALPWVSQISSGCSAGQCFGAQAVYRVSLALALFFSFMAALTALLPVTHLAGWLVKLLLYVTVLGLTLLIPNDNMVQFANAARVFSVVFLLAQVLIIIDFAYKVHEGIVARAEAYDADAERRGWEPGLLSNAWKVLYLIASLAIGITSLVGLGAGRGRAPSSSRTRASLQRPTRASFLRMTRETSAGPTLSCGWYSSLTVLAASTRAGAGINGAGINGVLSRAG
jgi:hypothetical protein